MNDKPEDDPGIDPVLDPGEDARIRALLADLGSGRAPEAASMPPEVAARLDETLAGLLAERDGTEEATPANVVPLRRRWSGRAAAAAAAVIVLGVGGVAVANLGGFAGSDSGSDSTAGGATESRAESQDSGTTSAPPHSDQPPAGLLPRDLPQLSAASFDAQVTRLVQAGQVPAPVSGNAAGERKSEPESDRSDAGALADTARGGCPGPPTEDGAQHTTVLYDGSPAALVVHPARSGKRLVEAWTCTGAQRLDSHRVPASTPTSGQAPGQTPGESSPGDPGLRSPAPTP